VFGHTAYAVATVLAAFMSGLAPGSALLGRGSDKSSNALALYGWVEVAIMVYGAGQPAGTRCAAQRTPHSYGSPRVCGSVCVDW